MKLVIQIGLIPISDPNITHNTTKYELYVIISIYRAIREVAFSEKTCMEQKWRTPQTIDITRVLYFYNCFFPGRRSSCSQT